MPVAHVSGRDRDVQGVQVSAPVVGRVSPAAGAKWAALGEGIRSLSGPFTSTAKYLWPARLGQSLAVAGALCEAHLRGYSHGYHWANEERDWPDHEDDRRHGGDWQPGCGWSL